MKRDILLPRLKSGKMATQAILNDTSENDSLTRGKDDLLPIRWQVGHLLCYARYTNLLLGGNPKISEDKVKPFGRGVKILEDINLYPPIAELRQELFELYDDSLQLAENIGDEILESKTPAYVGFDQPVIDSILFICSHDFYHFGQVAVVRRSVLGRDRTFG